MDRTREETLYYALFGIRTELTTMDEDTEYYKELYDFYIKLYEEYEIEVNNNIL